METKELTNRIKTAIAEALDPGDQVQTLTEAGKATDETGIVVKLRSGIQFVISIEPVDPEAPEGDLDLADLPEQMH